MIAGMLSDIHGHPVKYEQGKCKITVGSLLMHQPREQKYQLCSCLLSLGDQATVLKNGVSGMIGMKARKIITTQDGAVSHIPVYGIT